MLWMLGLTLLLFCPRVQSYQECDSTSYCNDYYYCCYSNTKCCRYGDLCRETSTYTAYCEQGYHCCGGDSCCPNTIGGGGGGGGSVGSGGAKPVAPIAGMLATSLVAWFLAKGYNSFP